MENKTTRTGIGMAMTAVVLSFFVPSVWALALACTGFVVGAIGIIREALANLED